MSLVIPKTFLWNTTVWNPSMISTALWLDASDNRTVVVSGGVVNQWNDKSGNVNNAVRDIGDPSLLTAAQNGLNTIRFYNAAASRMQFTLLTSLGHIFFVAKKLDVSDRNFIMRDGTANDRRGVIYGNATTSNFIVQQLAPTNTGATRNAWHVAEIETNGTTATLGIDATRVSAADADLMSISELGYYHTAIATYAFQGEIGEIVVSQSVLNAATRQRMEGYLAHKWGLTANLPSDHPYKSYGPKP